MSKESFKLFAKSHPELAESVLNNEVTWQKLYELYDIYGESSSIWDNYKTTTFKSLFNSLKNIDLDKVQEGVNNLEKTVGLLQGLGSKNVPNTYEERPSYKHFED